MSRKVIGGFGLVVAALALLGNGARSQTWWNPDYTKRVALTLKNNTGAATPTPTSVEASVPADAVNMRSDRMDVRVLYFNGTTQEEIDSKVFRETALPTSLNENLNAGKTDYNSLPAGTRLSALDGKDDAATVITIPFSFNLNNNISNQITVATDGFIKVGNTTYDPRPDNPTTATGGNVIVPFSSDLAVTDTAAGVYADTSNPNQVTIRWEVNESASGPVIAKFAAILYPDNSVRFVYSDTVNSPSAGIAGTGGYWPVVYGVAVGNSATSKLHADPFPVSLSNHADITYSQNLSIERARVVFRLQQPIPSGGTSTGQYFVYYGNSSPLKDVKRDVKNIFDTTLDMSAETIGQPASKWNPLEGGTMVVEDFQGTKIGRLHSGVSHPRALTKPGAIPDFLNLELLSHIVAVGGGEREMAPMSRAVVDEAHANQYSDSNTALDGGVGFVAFGFGDQSGFVSYINPTVDRGPAPAGLTPDEGQNGQFENILYRIQGDPGVMVGKNWTDGDPEPLNWLGADYSTWQPTHGSVQDPKYNKPGGVGIASYSQDLGIDYIAVRELRDIAGTTAAVESQTPTGPFIQGLVKSTKLGPLANFQVTLTDGTKTYVLVTGPDGRYRITLPAGTYTVSAAGAFHTPASVANVSPTPTGQTDLTLVYVGVTFSGTAREMPTNKRSPGATIVVSDENGYYVTETKTDANGNYTVMAPTGGVYNITSIGTAGHGERKTVTAVSGSEMTVNLAGTLVGNGDAEAPDSSNTMPKLWSTLFDAPKAYVYSHDINHTPGGHWSVGITDGGNPSGWNAPPAAFYNWPVLADTFDVTSSVWVYFTQPGQLARLRLRNSFVLAGVSALSGSTPDPNNENKGGLDNGKVPVNQWYEIRITHKVGDAGLTDGWNNNLYVYGAGNSADGFTATAGGTVYFDDFKFTLTPKASALVKVVDEGGAPVEGAYVGTLTDGSAGTALGFQNDYLTSPYSFTDAQGNAVLYTATAGTLPVAAWTPPAILASGIFAPYGTVAGTSTVTSSANPTTGTTITIKKGLNVAKGATATATDSLNTNLNPDALKNTTDDNLTSGWYSTDAPAVPYRILWDLGSVKQVDQIELWWERTEPKEYQVYAGQTTNLLSEDGASLASFVDAQVNGITESDFFAPANGRLKVIRFPSAKPVRYVMVDAQTPGDNPASTSSFLYEMRALSLASQPPALTKADLSRALGIAAGLTQALADDMFKLDIVKLDGTSGSDGSISLADVAAIAHRIQ